MPNITKKRYSGKMASRSGGRISNCIRDADAFGKEVPSFNLGGETNVNTIPGGFLTLAILLLTLVYATGKFQDLVLGSNPNIYNNIEQDYFGTKDALKLSDTNFRIAFGITKLGYETIAEPEPQLFKWVARIISNNQEDG